MYFGSADPLPYVSENGPRSPHTVRITVETANPNVVDRVRDLLFRGCGTLDLDDHGDPWETYVEAVEVHQGSDITTHIWSTAYEPDEV